MKRVESLIISNVLYKKVLAVLLAGVLLFGAVIPKNQEIKSNFITALSCVVNTVETNFYDQYSTIVMSAINCILNNFNIGTVLQLQLSKQQNQKKDNESSTPVNTSSDSGIIIQNITNNQIQTLKVNLSYLIYETTNKLYNICECVELSGTETSNMGILFFILFSILVVRIKDTIAVILNKKYRILNRLA